MKSLYITLQLFLLSQTLFAGGGGSGSSSQDSLLLWIPLSILLLIWGVPKLYSFLKTKFKKHIPEEEGKE